MFTPEQPPEVSPNTFKHPPENQGKCRRSLLGVRIRNDYHKKLKVVLSRKIWHACRTGRTEVREKEPGQKTTTKTNKAGCPLKGLMKPPGEGSPTDSRVCPRTSPEKTRRELSTAHPEKKKKEEQKENENPREAEGNNI